MTTPYADAESVRFEIELTPEGEPDILTLDLLEGPLALIAGDPDQLRHFAARLYVEVDREFPMNTPTLEKQGLEARGLG